MRERISTKYPFSSMPRQVAYPSDFFVRDECFTEEQFFKKLNAVNGLKKKVYYSIYTTNEEGKFNDMWDKDIVIWKPTIDCLSFDMDSEKCLENLRKCVEYCEKKNYKTIFVFSTGGFWIFIRAKNGKMLKNPKVALKNAQTKIAEEIGLTVGKADECDIDSSSFGDVARVTRAINTKDVDRNRFCIVLRKDEIYKTYEEICEIAKKPRSEYYIYGEEEVDMLPFDTGEETRKLATSEVVGALPQIDMKGVTTDMDIQTFLPCVQSWLVVPERGIWKARYYYAVYCSQTAVSPEDCNALARKYFTKQPRTDRLQNNYNHFMRDGTIRKAYKDEKVFPSCDTLIDQNLCPKKCKLYAGKNSPIYYTGEKQEKEDEEPDLCSFKEEEEGRLLEDYEKKKEEASYYEKDEYNLDELDPILK